MMYYYNNIQYASLSQKSSFRLNFKNDILNRIRLKIFDISNYISCQIKWIKLYPRRIKTNVKTQSLRVRNALQSRYNSYSRSITPLTTPARLHTKNDVLKHLTALKNCKSHVILIISGQRWRHHVSHQSI